VSGGSEAAGWAIAASGRLLRRLSLSWTDVSVPEHLPKPAGIFAHETRVRVVGQNGAILEGYAV
jgi:hypothetical protein